MKAEFELDIDTNGKPCIRFRHFDKDCSLDQKVLKIFIDAVKDKGCTLKNPDGYIDSDGNSWENYEIRINENE